MIYRLNDLLFAKNYCQKIKHLFSLKKNKLANTFDKIGNGSDALFF
jgi:hypothetical protein